MAPPISQVRAMCERLAGATADSVGATVHTLSPTMLAEAVRDRASVAVPVGEGLRRAAWCGVVGSLLAAFVQPFVVKTMNPAEDDWFQTILLRVLDRGGWWALAATACACIGLVTMVFTNGATVATRPGLVGLAVTATAGTATGLPALVAIVITVVAAAVIVIVGVFMAWAILALVCSAFDS